MAYDRDDRWRSERQDSWTRDGGRDRFDRDRDRDERGFFERAGDEISSWFGDDERDRRDEGDRLRSDHYRSNQGRSWGRHDRDSESDYGRGDRDSQWNRDTMRRTSFAGSAARSNHQDHPYEEWRRRHLDALDREYDEFRREHQSRFESDFGTWRERRQGKRSLLGSIREHMEVVGKDGDHVGTVDRVAGDNIILTKSDPASGGHHHSISCTMIDRVEDDRVILGVDSAHARDRWRDEERDRALFEREDQGEAGPGVLNRSFSGTYR